MAELGTSAEVDLLHSVSSASLSVSSESAVRVNAGLRSEKLLVFVGRLTCRPSGLQPRGRIPKQCTDLELRGGGSHVCSFLHGSHVGFQSCGQPGHSDTARDLVQMASVAASDAVRYAQRAAPSPSLPGFKLFAEAAAPREGGRTAKRVCRSFLSGLVHLQPQVMEHLYHLCPGHTLLDGSARPRVDC